MELRPGMLLIVNPEKCHDDLDDGPYLLISYDDGERAARAQNGLFGFAGGGSLDDALDALEPDPIWTCLDGDKICTMREEFLLACCDEAL